jgi:UDP-2,3-diacylglucosamine pyrophosphatase LpxH
MQEPTPARRPQLLAISDLHLGLDLRRGSPCPRPPPQDAVLETLLDHYEPRGGPHGWRLVIAGDMVDFIGMTVTPAPGEHVSFEVSEEERRSGLAPEPSKAVWKLGRVLERHERFFRRLAAFVGNGHELAIIRGNHDQEWTFHAVKGALVQALWELAAPSEPRSAFEARIHFHEWFYLEPGRVFVEHGHLHDEFSAAFDAGAHPPGLAEPVSSLALRWFGNRHDGLDMNSVDRWTFSDYLRWAIAGRRFWRASSDYLVMSGRLVARSTLGTARALRHAWHPSRRHLRRRERLRGLLAAVRDEQQHAVRHLAALWRAPADESLLLVAQMLYLDRFALLAATSAAILLGAALLPDARSKVGLLAAVMTGAAAANRLLSLSRRVESHPKLLSIAARIAERLSVPCVVMGHSHRAVDVRLRSGARYLNLGSWLPQGHACRAIIRLLVLDDEGPRLARWPDVPPPVASCP